MEFKKWFSGVRKGVETESSEVFRSATQTKMVRWALLQCRVLIWTQYLLLLRTSWLFVLKKKKRDYIRFLHYAVEVSGFWDQTQKISFFPFFVLSLFFPFFPFPIFLPSFLSFFLFSPLTNTQWYLTEILHVFNNILLTKINWVSSLCSHWFRYWGEILTFTDLIFQ